tara:strand:- start:274 stop:738 length:465 start_codon:yes stop_codon:yes gene_type:complete
MRIIQTSDKSLGKHFLLLGDDNKSLSLTTPTLIFKQIVKEENKYFIEVYFGNKKKFKQKLEDIIDFIKNYSRQNLGTPLFSHDLTGDTFKIKIPSRYSNFSTTFFNANKEVISYGELKDKCRIKILMETSGIWSNSRCTSFYFHAKEVLTDLRN